jgi:sec-independent protein translocase protein TatA
MGIGGISIWQLLIIALIIVLLFGTKKLRTLGSDLGGALKGFKQAVKDDDKDAKTDPDQLSDDSDGVNISARTEKAQDK